MKNANFIFAAVLVIICFLPPATQAQNWGPATPFPDPNGHITCMAEMNGELYVGGVFTQIGGVVANTNVAKWNGTAWAPVGTGPAVGPSCMLVYNNRMYVGRSGPNTPFTGYGARVWDGSTWTTTLNSRRVYDLCLYNGQIVAATDSGLFIGNGQAWVSFGLGVGGTILCVFNNELYLGNSNIGNGISKWTGSGWIDVAGVVSASPFVLCMEVFNNKLLVGGLISSLGGITIYNVAQYDGVTWTNVGFQNGSGPGGLNPGTVIDFLVSGQYLYMLSWQGMIGPTGWVQAVTRWDGTQWMNLGTDLHVTSTQWYEGALLIYDNFLYAGSNLIYINTSTAFSCWYLAKFNLSIASVSSNINSAISIFPNPVHDILTVTWSTADVTTLTLRDATGRVVRTYNVNGTQAQLSLEGLASGVYFLSVGGDTKAVRKIIKQ